MKYYTTFAASYGSGVYGACTYNDATSCTTTGTSTDTGTGAANGGGLVNTGFIVLVIATVACLLIFAGFVVRFWRRPNRLAVEPVRTIEEDARQDSNEPNQG
jgi:hypothetical protein